MREVTLTRDKTIFDVRSARNDGTPPKTIILRTCRLVTTQVVKSDDGKEENAHVVVVRGNTMIGTLRMFHILLRLNNMQGKFWNPQAIEDADTAWAEFLKEHLPEDVPPDWATVYLDGKPVICTWNNEAINAMEKKKVARPMDHKDMVAIGKAFFNSGNVARREVSVRHECNPAVIVENKKSEIKIKILSRTYGKLEPLFLRIEQEKQDAYLNDSMELATDIVELSNRIAEFNILKSKLLESQDLDYLRQREIKPASRELLEKLDGRISTLSDKMKVEYQPAQPEFHIPA